MFLILKVKNHAYARDSTGQFLRTQVFKNSLLVGGKLLYDVVLGSATQQCRIAMITRTLPPCDRPLMPSVSGIAERQAGCPSHQRPRTAVGGALGGVRVSVWLPPSLPRCAHKAVLCICETFFLVPGVCF